MVVGASVVGTGVVGSRVVGAATKLISLVADFITIVTAILIT